MRGKSVLVSGSGPIGILTLIAAKQAGAAHVTVTDITKHCLDVAAACGADQCIDVATQKDGLGALATGKGTIDVAFECSGNPQATAAAVMTVKPRGRMVLVGLGEAAPLPISTIVPREMELVGTFRFDKEFNEAAALIGSGKFDFSPVVSATYPIADAVKAFDHAGDRKRAIKVALRLDA